MAKMYRRFTGNVIDYLADKGNNFIRWHGWHGWHGDVVMAGAMMQGWRMW